MDRAGIVLIWIALIGTVLALCGGGLLYIYFRAARFSFVQKLVGGRQGRARLLCLAFFLALTALLWALWNMVNAVVCLLHLAVFWMAADLAAFLVARIRNKQPEGYGAGAAALILCTLWLAGGYVAAHHVWITEYTFATEKVDREVRLVQISDAHVGATFDAGGFLKHIEGINALEPDLVVVTGDFVDDDTSREDMLGACAALGKLDAPEGVYFVFGNHDKGYYSASSRGWNGRELRAALAAAGVVVLEDECQKAGETLLIAGRKDRSLERSEGRLSPEQLLSGAERNRYIVLLDHQPHDFDAEAAAGADLVLSGHTHGGQFIPVRHVGEWVGENALRYGHERRGNTDFVVSSGISNWTLQFKTGCRSEIVLIHIQPA